MSASEKIAETRSSFSDVTRKISKFAVCLILGAATLPQLARSAPSYATAVLADKPVAFWQLNETGDPTTGTLKAADSSGNGYAGTYGTSSYNGNPNYNILSPQPANGYLGFTNGQGAVQVTSGDVNSPVSIPFLNLNTNAVTIVMWINPYDAINANTGLLMNRNSGDAAGLCFGSSSSPDGSGMRALGYTWNTNAQATWSFNSGLYPLAGNWNFVALVVQSNSATLYLCNVDPNTGQTNILSAVNPIAHTPESFGGGSTWLGSDVVNSSTPDSGRIFPGYISGAAVYNASLTSDQITALFAAGLGVAGFPPSITTQPQDTFAVAGSPAVLKATGIAGTAPITYQWKLISSGTNGTDVNLLPDAANFVGANSNVLTILNASAADAGSYQLTLKNAIGTAVSRNALLTIQPGALVGHWMTNDTLADTSGFQPAGTHDGYDINGTGSYVFTNDVPPSKTGKSLFLLNGDTGIAIANSATSDANYTNTFDDRLHSSFTVGCFAKGWPGVWNPWISKFGENGLGWQLRNYGMNNVSPCWTIRGTGDNDDMAATSVNLSGDLDNWHFYVGTYDVVTRVRNLYVDGVLRATTTNQGSYAMAPDNHLVIGARENAGYFGNYFTGQIYDVRVYNYALSQSQILDWYGAVPPSIASQPSSIAVFLGSPASFSVTAGGTPPLNYQWQLNGTNVNLLPDAANFTGATSNVLAILNVSSNDVGSYQVVVTSSLGYGTITSSKATLSLSPMFLLGQWFTNGTLSDLSGHTPAGTHDAIPVGTGNYTFVNDLPPGILGGQSVQFPNQDSGVMIDNSSTADAAYADTFDTPALSVAFWAKGRGTSWLGLWEARMAKGGYNNNGEYDGFGWSVGLEAWSQYLYFQMDGIDKGGIGYNKGAGLWGNNILEGDPNNIPGDDNWHHYACTYNPQTGVRRMYFDGTMVTEQTGNAAYTQAPDKHLTIGCQEQTYNGFVGFVRSTMFDVRMYNYPLSASEVVALIPDPAISAQPVPSLNAYVGVTTRISATVITHSTPVTMQWQLNGTNLANGPFDGAIISGADSSTLTLANVTASLQGVYRLIVSDPAGTTISSNTVVTVLTPSPVPAGNLVGQWVAGAANLADTSGYSPAGTHDGYGVSGTGTLSSDYSFTSDVPPGGTGSSLVLKGTTAIAIAKSSDSDAAYVNTFDDLINTNGMTIMCWAKGLPGTWSPWVSKYGENGLGWQLRVNGDAATPCWTIRGPGSDDMSSTLGKSDGNWHNYVGTYDPVAGVRNLYVDGVLAATRTGQGAVNPSTSSYLVIGARDNGGNNFGNYFNGEIYGVRIYKVALTEAQVNSFLVTTTTAPPVINQPVRIGNQLILTWSNGTLQQATNLLGPWTPVEATSPYTNDVTAAPQKFFRVSNP